jgi:UDP-N-acetylmuramyl pentapeptide synthase
MMPDGRAEAFSAAELAAAAGGTLVRASERPIRGGAVDSREVRPGNAFVALPGDRTDGHAFLAEATARGAAALVVSRDLDEIGPLGDVTIIRVADGLAALGGIAAAWRMRFQPLVVGVTGSIAKTSTKEAIASVLGSRMHVLRSEGNRNNEIGLPLTILDLASDHEAAVLEMGMYVGGEIADLARIARPSVGVVTAVQGVHLSRIGTLEAIEAAKAELIEALPSADEGGVAVLNADDAIVRRMAGRTTARVITYGFATDADVGRPTSPRRASRGCASCCARPKNDRSSPSPGWADSRSTTPSPRPPSAGSPACRLPTSPAAWRRAGRHPTGARSSGPAV